LEKERPKLEATLRETALTAAIDMLREKADIDQSGAEGIDPKILSNLSIVE
jgi:peptidyl-prolyl cis-trans isomerase C